ncbi:MAG: hypothetical protein KGM98_15180 [Bacteroidota bacterium]|nr:hypothetical protein [Bacteroidota bacterium]
MSKSGRHKKKKKSSGALYFLAFTAITAVAAIYIIKEGERIKKENELLSYEVW